MREEVSIAAFIAGMAGKRKEEVRLDAEREKAEADRFAARTPLYRRGVPSGPTQEVWRAYGQSLRGFLHFIYHNSRPPNAPTDFGEFRPLVESWVRAGDLPAESLGAFDGAGG